MVVTSEESALAAHEDAARWLLRFVQADSTPMRAVERVTRAVPFALAGGNSRLFSHEVNPSSETLELIRRELAQALDALQNGQTWEFRHAPETWHVGLEHEPALADERIVSGRKVLTRRFVGELRQLFVARAIDTLVRFWPRFRTCKRSGCGRLFLPTHGGQVYDDPRCSQTPRQRQQTFKQKHPRRRRHRDYHAEYVARMKKQYGPKVRIGQRRRLPRIATRAKTGGLTTAQCKGGAITKACQSARRTKQA